MLKIKSDENAVRTNVALAISYAIRKNGIKKINEFTEELESKYQIYLFDCYDHPIELKKTLLNLYPNEFEKIINDIDEECEPKSDGKNFSEFIATLKKPITDK